MPTTTIRISDSTRKILGELARQDGKSLQAVIDQAIEHYRRQRFLEGLHNDFDALRSDTEGWNAEKEERAAWDATLADGEGT